MGNGGAFFSSVDSVIVYSSSLSLNVSDQVRAGTVPVQGRGTAQYLEGGCHSVGKRKIDSSQTLNLPLIGRVNPGAVYSCKSSKGHWVEPQTVDFY